MTGGLATRLVTCLAAVAARGWLDAGMSEYDGFSVSADGAVGRLTIDRADKRNAVTSAMWQALPDLLAGLAKDPQVKVLVVTGAGASFSAGADIADLVAGDDPADPMAAIRGHNLRAQAALRDFPKPTIAMIRGHCIGGGMEIAACCDLRFADRTAVFGVTPARIGVIYPPEAIRGLVDLVGPATAKYLLFSGELLTADESYAKGLVDRLCDDLESDVRRFAEVLLSRSQLTIHAVKETVAALLTGTDPEPAARARYLETFTSGELPEGVAAFRAKRPPAFTWTP
jgi:enoyl-CoA hydratase/carnithine racemase